MSSKKNVANKIKSKDNLKKKVIETTSQKIEDISASSKEFMREKSASKLKNHWGIIQKDFKVLADDMLSGFKDAKEILSERGAEGIKDIQSKMNFKFSSK